MAAGVLATFAVGWFALARVAPVPTWIGLVPLLFAPPIGALACWDVSRLPSTDPTARRAWRLWSLTLWSVTVVMALEAADLIARSGVPRRHPGPGAMIFAGASAAIVVWWLVRLPVNRRSRGAWLTFGLDSGIVLLAVCQGAWYAVMRDQLAEPTGSGMDWSATGLGLAALSSLAVLFCFKLILAGTGSPDRQALVRPALGALIAALGCVPVGSLPDQTYLSISRLTMPVAVLFFVLGADRQRRCTTRTVPPAPAPAAQEHRRFRIFPYFAFATTVLPLLDASRGLGRAGQVVVLSAIVIGALVVLRQIVAFYSNARLVTRLNASMVQLTGQAERFRLLVQHSSDLVLITDVGGRCTYASPSLECILGVPVGEWTGRTVSSLVHPGDRAAAGDTMVRLLDHPEVPVTVRFRLQHADGEWRWLEAVTMNRLADPAIGGFVSNARDVTEARLYQERLAHQARHDVLTRLANRSLLIERAASALAELGRPAGCPAGSGTSTLAGEDTVALALVDLDDFKAINDRLGHAVGDAVLMVLADRLRDGVDAGDTVARLGGDEFAILLRDRSAADTDAVVGRLANLLEEPVRAAGYDLLVQASIGLVEATAGMDASELLRRADVAMYAVKEQGKSGVGRYTAAMDASAVEHARIGAELQQAMMRGELYAVYQPVVSLPTGRVVAFEALMRWNHPSRGPVSPGEFIPVAERNGLIVQLGGWVLWEACHRLAEWRRDGLAAGLRMSVNVSARQLREPRFAQSVADVLADTGLSPQDLVLEITETAVFGGGPAVESVLAVHALGVDIALDDFGTGHSSLGLLRTCPVDVLKVDKMFVDDVAGTDEDAAIATSIAQIAHAMGLRAVAEGVETAEQAVRLHELGYRLAQGFLFSRPLTSDDATSLLLAAAVAAQEPGGARPRAATAAPATTDSGTVPP